jgi:molybdopterin-guanine dinucleotide biosynthesis protein A
MGMPKGLVEIDGEPWILHQLRAVPPPVIVVVGRERYEGLVVDPVVNEDPDRGPFSSVRTGALHTTAASAFILPLDVPSPDPRVYRALEQAGPCAVPVFEGRGGHPVLVPLEPIRQARDDDRLDHLLARLHPRRVPVDDRRVRMNLNTPADWDELFRRRGCT